MKQWLAAVAVLTLASGAAMGQWNDNFDGYALGSGLHGQGGWHGWDGDIAWDAYVTDDQALSSPQSVNVSADADIVHEYDATSGQWTYTAWQYIPTGFSGISYFILLNTYNDGGPYNWSIQLPFDSATGLVTDDYAGGPGLAILFDQWAEIRVEIDLDNNFREVYYNGDLLASFTWTTDVDSVLELAAVDLFANGASPVYYDDMSLVPAPAGVFVLLLAGAVRRRR